MIVHKIRPEDKCWTVCESCWDVFMGCCGFHLRQELEAHHRTEVEK